MTTGDDGAASLNLDDPDRLPWLEPADDDFEEEGVSPAKVAGLVLLGLALLGLIVGGGWWLTHRGSGQEEARLIPAQGGDYKIPANASSGKTFDGEGDASYATSEGVNTGGKVDASRLPEAPMAGAVPGSIARDDAARNAHDGAAKPAAHVTAAVKDATQARAGAGAVAAVAPSGSSMIQLGAYGNEAVAREAWTKLSRRFDYLASLSTSIQKVEVGGATLYRLRAGAGDAASAAKLCGRLKVAGESCMVVK